VAVAVEDDRDAGMADPGGDLRRRPERDGGVAEVIYAQAPGTGGADRGVPEAGAPRAGGRTPPAAPPKTIGEEHGNVVVDPLAPADQVLAAVGRVPDRRFAAADDPWVLDRAPGRPGGQPRWYLGRSTGIVAVALAVAAFVWGFVFSARATGTKLRLRRWRAAPPPDEPPSSARRKPGSAKWSTHLVLVRAPPEGRRGPRRRLANVKGDGRRQEAQAAAGRPATRWSGPRPARRSPRPDADPRPWNP